jgi:beta-glucosidase
MNSTGKFKSTLFVLSAGFLLSTIHLATAQENAVKYRDFTASPEDRAADLVSRMTLAEKVSQMQNTAVAIPRLGIPAYDWWNEALHGVARAGLATVFPQAIGLGATWDTDLERRISTIISTEARAKYNDAIAHGNHGRYYGLTFWSPNINIFRDPRWGRGQETYGEDPYLTAQMAIQFVKGMQGDDPHYFKTIATSKHFAVHSGPELLRHKFNVDPSEQDLNDTYLYAFRQTVEQAHVDSIMCVYNAVDGVPGCASDMLLKGKLRADWKFQGYVVSDCDAVDDIYVGHHYAKSLAEASAMAVKAGTDLDCGKAYAALTDAVQQGLIDEKEIDRSVRRLFTARFRLGMFDPPERVPFSSLGEKDVASAANRKVSLEAAEKAIVLLKNDDRTLPMTKAPKRIAVIGPAADDPDALLGNYNGIPSHIVTPLQGIEREFGKRSTVGFALGSTYVAGWSALVPENALSLEAAGERHGLLAEYFASEDFTGKPLLSRTEPRVRFDLQAEEPALSKTLPPGGFSARWTGYLKVSQAGEYSLGAIRPDCDSCGRVDAWRIYVDEKLAASDEQEPHGQMLPKTSPITLETGRAYKIRVDYTKHGRGAGLELVWTPPAEAALREALDLMKDSDAAILCVGLNSRLEGEESRLAIPGFEGGDRTDLRLPEPQRKLIQAVIETGKPAIVVLINGSALAVDDLKPGAKAILEAWYGGQEAGTAIADTLAGKNNPAGRLPITFYASVDDLPPFTDYSMQNRTYRYFKGTPVYPFGYGLSYSTFAYSGLKLATPGAETTTVTAIVKNTSPREGDEVAQLYLSQAGGSNQELRGFERLHLKAGEQRTVRFEVNNTELAGRVLSVGSGQPLQQWTGDRFVQVSTTPRQ